jgi:CheY-like chemotaxis protein
MPDGGRLLVVEHNADDIELMLAALTECGLAERIDVVRDGEAALDYLQRRGRYARAMHPLPAAVVLDLKLPKRDGLEVLASVRADTRLRHLPIVVVTASRETGDVQRSYAAGANAYVVKPLQYGSYVAVIQDIARFWLVRNQPA